MIYKCDLIGCCLFVMEAKELKKNGKKVHSTQKPESFMHRILLASTNKGDFVFDPFLGTGTTAVVAKKLGRNYFGIERKKNILKRQNKD